MAVFSAQTHQPVKFVRVVTSSTLQLSVFYVHPISLDVLSVCRILSVIVV